MARQHHDRDAEQGVLGGILLRNEALRAIADLEVDDFAHAKHKAIFAAMRNLEGTPIDQTTLRAELVRLSRWEFLGSEVDAQALLMELALRTPSSENVAHYAAILVRHRVTRDLKRALADCIAGLDDEEYNLEGEDAVLWAQSKLREIRTRNADASMTVGAIVRERVEQYEQIAERRLKGDTSITGLPTGVEALDRLSGGYQRRIVTVLCGRPAMGKSSLAMAAADACSAQGVGVHVFSLEDPRWAYADRVISRLSQVPSSILRRVEYTRDEFHAVGAAIGTADRRKSWCVDDRGGLTAQEIIRSWRRIGEAHATQLVVVDLLQRIRKSDPRQRTYDHVTEVMHLLSDAAKADGIALVLVAQLNRQVEARDDKRPMLSDLQDAGTVEQDAKCVIGCYRGRYYGTEPVEGVDYPENGRCPSLDEFEAQITLCVLKDSNGPTGQVHARWHGPTTRIS